jgi:hypothetical protein
VYNAGRTPSTRLPPQEEYAGIPYGCEPERLKKSPVVADENVRIVFGAVEMDRGTGDDLETCTAFDFIFLIFNLTARHGNVGWYRQYNRK